MQPTEIATVLCLLLPALAAQQDASFEIRLERGRELALAKEWAAALSELAAALEMRPDDLDALRWRGHAYTGAERYPEALVGHTRAHRLDPNLSKPIEWRGYTLSLMGENSRALADIDLALRMSPGNPWLRLIRAKIHVALLDFDKAEADLWRVVDADESHAGAHAQLGYLSACTGDRITARNMLTAALKLDPEGQFEARLWLFHLRNTEGNQQAARIGLFLARRPPSEPDAELPDRRWARHIATYLAGELEEAELLRLAEAEAPTPNDRRGRRCEAWLHIGTLRRQSADRATSIEALAHAVATDARDKWEWSWARRQLTELCFPED